MKIDHNFMALCLICFGATVARGADIGQAYLDEQEAFKKMYRDSKAHPGRSAAEKQKAAEQIRGPSEAALGEAMARDNQQMFAKINAKAGVQHQKLAAKGSKSRGPKPASGEAAQPAYHAPAQTPSRPTESLDGSGVKKQIDF